MWNNSGAETRRSLFGTSRRRHPNRPSIFSSFDNIHSHFPFAGIVYSTQPPENKKEWLKRNASLKETYAVSKVFSEFLMSRSRSDSIYFEINIQRSDQIEDYHKKYVKYARKKEKKRTMVSERREMSQTQMKFTEEEQKKI